MRTPGEFNPWLAAVMSFLCTSGYYAVNEVAIELEDPFGDDANDLPMQHYQYEFNCRLQTESLMDHEAYTCPPLDPTIAALYETWAQDEDLWSERVEKRQGLKQGWRLEEGQDLGGCIVVDEHCTCCGVRCCTCCDSEEEEE